jgi:hypothetical protein
MDPKTAIGHFFTAWNASTPDERRAAVTAAFDEAATVCDPLGEVEGHDAIVDFIAAAVSEFPGHTFRPAGGLDVHHDRVRFAWLLVDPQGAPVVEGLEVARLASDGRLASTVGFFGPIPAAEEVAA